MSHDEMTCENLLLKLQQLEFVAVDLNLYLDNHPDCKSALADYNMVVRELMRIKKLYEQQAGPLSNFGCSESPSPWAWVNDPWPWEYNFREV